MNLIYRLRFILKTFFFLPGTLLHEFLHWFGLIMLGFRNTSLTLIPRKASVGNEYVMGSASGSLARSQSDIRWIIPALLPKISWAALYWLLVFFEIAEVQCAGGACSIRFFYGDLNYGSWPFWLLVYVMMQLWWAGTLSFQDWIMVAKGVTSGAGLVIALFVGAALWIYNCFDFQF
ncbi:hypothetical protein ACXWTF_12805 [Thiomicrolovo sp. ZZH C-3]